MRHRNCQCRVKRREGRLYGSCAAGTGRGACAWRGSETGKTGDPRKGRRQAGDRPARLSGICLSDIYGIRGSGNETVSEKCRKCHCSEHKSSRQSDQGKTVKDSDVQPEVRGVCAGEAGNGGRRDDCLAA